MDPSAKPAGEEAKAERSEGRLRWRERIGLIVGLLLLGLVILVVWRLGDAGKFAELVARAEPGWLVLAAALQVGTYACAGAVWWTVLRRGGSRIELGRLVLLSVAKIFTDQAIPSGGMAGTLLLVHAVVRRGTPSGVAAAALVVNLIGFYASFLFASALALAWFSVHHHASTLLLVLIALLVVVALAVVSALIILIRGRAARLSRWLTRFEAVRSLLDAVAHAPMAMIRDRVNLATCFGLQLATIALDGLTLCATLASVGAPVRVLSVIACFVFAMVAEVVGVVPGGLGTFEGTSIALLHATDVAIEPALAATLLLRGFTFWLPMLPGVWLLRLELKAELEAKAPPGEGARLRSPAPAAIEARALEPPRA